MKVHILKVISDKITERFENLLQGGEFPEVGFKKDECFRSYDLFKYSDLYSTFAKIVDVRVQKELGERYGVFTRKHSADFLAKIEDILNTIEAEDLKTAVVRFRSFSDNF